MRENRGTRPLMIMPSNDSSSIVHFLAGRYEGNVGWCQSPKWWKKPSFYMPYILDNGAFAGFDKQLFLKALSKTTHAHPPMFICVPDVVGEAEATFIKWHYWHRRVAPYGRLAFVAQDGMEPQDVPPEAYACFIGGTNNFKFKQAHRFKGVCQWFHIGRVNTPSRLRWAKDIGADSVDGTGFLGMVEMRTTNSG